MKSAHHGQLMLSVGALLATEREKRGIPVEKAAKETRMRPQRIRDMEGDDLSHFTNPSYARMFIIAYAKYLGIPMKTIREHLPDRGEAGTEGYQYVNTSTEELPSLRGDIATRPARRKSALYRLAIATLCLVLLGIAGIIFYLSVNLERLTAAVDKPPPTPAPTPARPAPKPVTLAEIGLSNLRPGGEKVAAFEGEIALETPPAPVPASVLIKNPATAQNATVAPAPAIPAASADRAFLLKVSPGASPGINQ